MDTQFICYVNEKFTLSDILLLLSACDKDEIVVLYDFLPSQPHHFAFKGPDDMDTAKAIYGPIEKQRIAICEALNNGGRKPDDNS